MPHFTNPYNSWIEKKVYKKSSEMVLNVTNFTSISFLPQN